MDRLVSSSKGRPIDGIVVIDGKSDVSYKILYLEPSLEIGSQVQAGKVLGQALDISGTENYYSSDMINHVHVKLRVGGKVVNPGAYIEPSTDPYPKNDEND